MHASNKMCGELFLLWVNSPFYILLFVLHFWTDLYFFLTFSYELNYLLDFSMYFIYFVFNFSFLIHGDFHIL